MAPAPQTAVAHAAKDLPAPRAGGSPPSQRDGHDHPSGVNETSMTLAPARASSGLNVVLTRMPSSLEVADREQPAASPSGRLRVARTCASWGSDQEGRFPALSRDYRRLTRCWGATRTTGDPYCAATVASERTIPILPCRLLDDVLPFYEALAFEVTYRQARPNPYAVVSLDDIELRFCEPPEFDPERSYGSVIIVVP